MNRDTIRDLIILALTGGVLFFPLLGSVHLFDWDEMNFAACAREMLVSGNYLQPQINFQPFLEKPPLFFWLQAASMRVFGINEFAARLPNAVAGIFTLWFIYLVGRKWRGSGFGRLWALVLLGTFLPHFYFRSGIIDPVLNLLILTGFYAFIRPGLGGEGARTGNTNGWFALSGLLLGLAVLTKGPVGVLLPGLTVIAYVILFRGSFRPGWKSLLTWAVVFLLTTVFWYGLDLVVNGPEFIRAFLERQWALLTTSDAGHGQPVWYHPVVILIGCFPASLLLVAAMKKRKPSANGPALQLNRWMWILFLVVLIVFSLVRTKIVHYSSLSWIPLTYLATDYLYRHREGFRWAKAGWIILFALGLFWLAVLVLVPLLGRNPGWISHWIADPFALSALQASVNWPWFTWLPALFMAVALALAFRETVRGSSYRAVVLLMIGNIVLVQAATYLFVPRIEAYSQRAAVELVEEAGANGHYVLSIGFKSYIPFFYGRYEHTITGLEPGLLLLSKQPKGLRLAGENGWEVVTERNGYVLLNPSPGR